MVPLRRKSEHKSEEPPSRRISFWDPQTEAMVAITGELLGRERRK